MRPEIVQFLLLFPELIDTLVTLKLIAETNNTLRKHAYLNILKILLPKHESLQIKILIFFIFLLKNIDCVYSLEPPRRGGSNAH